MAWIRIPVNVLLGTQGMTARQVGADLGSRGYSRQ